MEIELETQINDMHMNDNIDTTFDEIEAEFAAESKVPQTPSGMSASSTQQKKKRKRDNKGSLEMLETLVDTIKEIKIAYQEQSANIAEFVSCLKHEKEGVD